MVTQTKTDTRFADVQKIMKGLLNKPITKMTKRELSILPVALTFGECFYKDTHDVEIDVRDLHGKHGAQSLNQLCDMLCLVESYNSYDPKTVCDVLEKHKDFINFDETSFGREYSPVLYLSLKQYYGEDGPSVFMERAKALAKDLQEICKCDELQWCVFSTPNGFFKEDLPLTMWCPVRDGEKITGYEEKTFDHFRKFRVWWD
ncbi:MAG: hypothetical protein EKK63_12260 [Acinetobacter sp.]|uniref:hypothetical protein n=1 Tax=Acinetobacter sp. TaxID=472 RepID=UPI000F94296C|nr:hypothetical protein [Acinetobacter sp.]RUP38437.1 MAG: hypothetical protein EKK63_12260 [Acinetobacter sp.]